jgi:hypothetical protein
MHFFLNRCFPYILVFIRWINLRFILSATLTIIDDHCRGHPTFTTVHNFFRKEHWIAVDAVW